MSVGAVTARSAGVFVAPTRTARVHKFPLRGAFLTQSRFQKTRKASLRRKTPTKVAARRLRARLTRQQRAARAVITPVQATVARRALAKLAVKLIAKRILGSPLEAIIPILEIQYTRFIDPVGFPGWGNFPAGWTSNAGTVWPGKEIGTYTANGFDNVPNWSTVALNLIDTSDGAPIPGFRFWGHYDTDPGPNGAPGIDWPIQHVKVAVPRVAPRYRKLNNLAPRQAQARWTARSSIAIGLTGKSGKLNMRVNPKRTRNNDTKLKPKSQFVYGVMKAFANSGGEFKEWVDIFADASMYIKGSKMLPEHLRNTGKETQAKIYWLFFIDGVNGIDFDHLAKLIRENVVEDLAFGALGQLSKYAAIHLDLTVGPQTGLVM